MAWDLGSIHAAPTACSPGPWTRSPYVGRQGMLLGTSTTCLLPAHQAPLPGCPGQPKLQCRGDLHSTLALASTKSSRSSSRESPAPQASCPQRAPRPASGLRLDAHTYTRIHMYVHTHVVLETHSKGPVLEEGQAPALPPGGGERGKGGEGLQSPWDLLLLSVLLLQQLLLGPWVSLVLGGGAQQWHPAKLRWRWEALLPAHQGSPHWPLTLSPKSSHNQPSPLSGVPCSWMAGGSQDLKQDCPGARDTPSLWERRPVARRPPIPGTPGTPHLCLLWQDLQSQGLWA